MSTRVTGEIGKTIILAMLGIIVMFIFNVLALLVEDWWLLGMVLVSIIIVIASLVTGIRADRANERIRESSTAQDHRR
jgi:ABC-type bacteriocin/lantibiotic exporter with double-glycine peptidase domain